MIVERPLPFISEYLNHLNSELRRIHPGCSLSSKQRLWLGFVLSTVLLTNSICWKRFERASLGKFKHSALSWMFCNSKIFFETLFETSIRQILSNYGIKEGVICIDDVDRNRSKSTKTIYGVHKLKDKLSGGFVNGQCLVFLVLVTPTATFPIGFEFFRPDPKLKAWKKEDERLKKQKIPKKQRPIEPDRNPDYPTKVQLSLQLLKRFQQNSPELKIKGVVADGLYGHAEFMDEAAEVFAAAQVITKMKYNQQVFHRNKYISVEQFFKQSPLVSQQVFLRGEGPLEVLVSSARLKVKSHGKKRFVIAIRYPNEKQPRYLMASDLTWRTLDIVQCFFFRWLIEVFFEDWKGHEGWGKLTKHPGEDGSRKSLILSLMLDHVLLFHHAQKASLENKLPASSVGSLSQRIQAEALVQFVQDLAKDGIDEQKIKRLKENIDNIIPLNPSKKHMSHRVFPYMQPAPGLKRFKHAA